MSIDKSLKQHYANVPKKKKIEGQWHKLAYITSKEASALKNMGGIETRTPEGIFAYPGGAGTPGGYGGGPDMGGGTGGNTGGSNNGPSGGGNGRSQALANQAKAKSTPKETKETKDERDHHGTWSVTVPDKVPDKGPEPDEDIEGKKVRAPKSKPKEETITYHGKDDQVFTITKPKKLGQTYYQDRSKIGGDTWGQRAEEGIKRPFLESGLGTLLKGVGTTLAFPVASAFLPKDMMTALTWAKRAKDIKEGKGILGWTANKLGLAEKLNLSNLKGDINWNNRVVEPDGRKESGNGIDNIAQKVASDKDVITESAKKFAGLQEKRNLMKNALDEGWYTDSKGRTIQLTTEQKSMLNNYITQIDKYLVDPKAMAAYGGRIDKPLTGRSRDI